MPPRLQHSEEEVDEHTKELFKEAMKEWLDEKYATFGRWAVTSFAALVFVALVYFVLKSQGWQLVEKTIPQLDASTIKR